MNSRAVRQRQLLGLRQRQLLGSTHMIRGDYKAVRDCTVDEIGQILDGIAGSIEVQAAELRSAVEEFDDEGAIDDLVNQIDGDIRDLVDIYAYRESLRR